ncbi:epoxide hydrolase [Fusarium langsethiae]|uniref:Epoxide hydrolase n=1 Tax=Fusarium langsethiae TaxID=179993 RepID=A0A0N0DB62_FUSLA|nr:epoxide hydrolase [Fusarium langsethiae]
MTYFHKLVPNDPNIKTVTKSIRGKSYSYITACPRVAPILTVFLLHGFPDLSFGWRYQVPYLVSLGYEVVALDMLGCGDSAAPGDLHHYTFKSVANDIKVLAKELVGERKIVLGGHGLGGAVAWRTAIWHPDLVLGIFSISTPFFPPSTMFVTPDDPALAFKIKPPGSRDNLKDECPGMPNSCRSSSHPREGVEICGKIQASNGVRLIFKHIAKLRLHNILSRRESLVYLRHYLPHGEPRVEGPLRWFHLQTRSYNRDEEQQFFLNPWQTRTSALYISGDRHEKAMSAITSGMMKYFPNLVSRRVTGSYWCLWESTEEVNEELANWIAMLTVDKP